MRVTINAAIIEKGLILLVKKNQAWILPGGKPFENESDLDCLQREVREELSGTELKDIRYYTEFVGVTPHKGDILKSKVYFASLNGKLNSPSAEIDGYVWINNTRGYDVSDITNKTLLQLKAEGMI